MGFNATRRTWSLRCSSPADRMLRTRLTAYDERCYTGICRGDAAFAAVGTVGGGTVVDTQQECRRRALPAAGHPRGTNAKKLAELMARRPCSLLGALGAQHLARAHQQWAAVKFPFPRTTLLKNSCFLEPEPLHHDDGIFTIGIVVLDSEHVAVSHPAVETLATVLETCTSSAPGCEPQWVLVLDRFRRGPSLLPPVR